MDVRGSRALTIAMPSARYAICASISVVTSTMSEADASGAETPCRTSARAPIAIPPSWEKGSTSEAESRTSRARTKIQAPGPQEAAVIRAHAAVVLGETEPEQCGDVEVVADRFCPRHGEIAVLHAVAHVTGDAHALPDETQPDAQHLQLEPRAPPQRHVAAMPGGPVDEEQDVPGFLLDDRLEALDQRLGKEAGASRRLEQAEGEETVDALAVAGLHEGPFRIARRQVLRLGRERDTIGRDEMGEHGLVAAFLEGVELDRLAQQRIRSYRREGSDVEPRPALGLHGNVPDGQAHETLACAGVELRPIDHRRPVGIEGVEERAAEERLVGVASRPDRSLGPRVPRGANLRNCRAHDMTRRSRTPWSGTLRARKSANPPTRSVESRQAASTSGGTRASSSSRWRYPGAAPGKGPVAGCT